ncbi:hypothetical protein AMECASPLE_029922 [Ameca splendens]|uniref:Uncharacterized protein n=1 Tax=Ameca splendens TaxID=208324 RepID=A0ABV1AC76_9TELE
MQCDNVTHCLTANGRASAASESVTKPSRAKLNGAEPKTSQWKRCNTASQTTLTSVWTTQKSLLLQPPLSLTLACFCSQNFTPFSCHPPPPLQKTPSHRPRTFLQHEPELGTVPQPWKTSFLVPVPKGHTSEGLQQLQTNRTDLATDEDPREVGPQPSSPHDEVFVRSTAVHLLAWH